MSDRKRCNLVHAARGLDGPEIELECGARLRLTEEQNERRQVAYDCPKCNAPKPTRLPHLCTYSDDGCAESTWRGGNWGIPICHNPEHHRPRPRPL